MEGLIPYLYKALVQHKDDHHNHHGTTNESWLRGSSPSASYMRLSSGDSGRFQTVSSDMNISSSRNQVVRASETRLSPNQCLVSRHGINVHHDPQAILMH